MTKSIDDFAFGVILLFKPKTGEPQVLTLRHSLGHWGLPKGHVEGDETPVETAERELGEETGIKNVDIRPDLRFKQHYSFERQGKRYNKEVVYFLAETDVPDVEVDNDEIVDYAWVPLSRLRRHLVVNGRENEVVAPVLDYLSRGK